MNVNPMFSEYIFLENFRKEAALIAVTNGL
jgi:hypothetical protein